MAVDTAQKRFSMLNFGQDDNLMLFEPDGSVDLDDRQHLLGCYSGIAFDAPTVIADQRTVAGTITVLLNTGDQLTLRTERTSGADDLETTANSTAMTVVLYQRTQG